MAVRMGTVQKWIESLDPSKTSIEFAVDEGIVRKLQCKLCTKFVDQLRSHRNYNSAFVDGITGAGIKKDTVKKHLKSEMHIRAANFERRPASIAQVYRSTAIGRAFSSASEAQRSQVGRLFEVAHMIAKQELPFTAYESIVNLEQKHGVQFGTAYHNRIACSEMIRIMEFLGSGLLGEMIEFNLAEALRSTPYFSIMIDGATDVSVIEKELIYVVYLEQSGTPAVRFLRLKNIESGTAKGIQTAITTVLDEIGIPNWQNKLVAFVADGAAVNLGQKKSVSTLLKKHSPWLVSIHCFNHRLELAIKDALGKTYFSELVDLLNSLYSVYNQSCKRLRELREMSVTLRQVFVKPQRVDGTRWISFKVKAIKAVITSYPVLISHLKMMANSTDTKAADKIRFVDLVDNLTSFRVVANLVLFSSLLQPVASLSQQLQGDGVDFLYALNGITATKMNITKALANPELKALLNDADAYERQYNDYTVTEITPVKFKGVALRDVSGGIISFYANKTRYVQAVNDALDERFDNVAGGDSIFRSLKILDVSAWPKATNTGVDSLAAYGSDEITSCLEHFQVILENNGVDVTEIMSEWTQLKYFQRILDHLNRHAFWKLILSEHRTTYPNLCHLISLLLLIPISNAVLERFFSVMKRVKTDWRSSLGEKCLEHLLRIEIESPSTEEFDPQACVSKFFESPRRLTAHKTGPHKRRKVASDTVVSYGQVSESTDSDSDHSSIDPND